MRRRQRDDKNLSVFRGDVRCRSGAFLQSLDAHLLYSYLKQYKRIKDI